MTSTFSSLANNVDSAISSRRDIGSRLHNSSLTLGELEMKLSALQTFITSSVDRYQTVENQVTKDILSIKNQESKKSWWNSTVEDVKAGWNKLEDSVEHGITEAEDNASKILNNATKEAFEIIGGVLYYRGKSIDFIENAAETAIQHLQESILVPL